MVVTGAAGHQGNAVARELLRQREETRPNVRAMVHHRDRAAVQELEMMGAEIAEGDFDDRDSVAKALEGATAVFSVQDFFSAGFDGEVRQGQTVADVAKAVGVEHFIYSSVGSAHRDTGIPHFDSKRQIEQHIQQSGLSYTILRPVFFYYNYKAMRQSTKKRENRPAAPARHPASAVVRARLRASGVGRVSESRQLSGPRTRHRQHRIIDASRLRDHQ